MTEDPVGFKVRFRICKSICTAIPAIVHFKYPITHPESDQGGSNHIPIDKPCFVYDCPGLYAGSPLTPAVMELA